MAKKKLKQLRQVGTALKRVPVLGTSATRHILAPVGFRYFDQVRKGGVKDAHWKVLGDGLAQFLQQSGPVLTKLGQILATRGDLLPAVVCERLEVLYDRQPPMKRAELEKILRDAYGKKLPFAEFSKQPLGVGSVGQVHRAKLRDGRPVIVKIVRPGITREIKRDIETLQALSGLVFWLSGEKYRTTQLVLERVLEDLQTGFLSEVDLKSEARALERFRSRVSQRVYVPEVISQYSSKSVLVLEELKGESLNKFRERAKDDTKAAKQLAELALKEILTQIFDEGSFHADPHAGNFLVMEDGRLGLIDFGLTGEFTSGDRKKIGKAVKALMSRDADGVIKALLEFGTTPRDFKVESFKAEIVELVGKSAKEVIAGGGQLDQLVNDLFKITYRHQVYVPQSTTLLIKTLVTIEGVARSLDPEIKLLPIAIPVVLRSLTPKWLRFFSTWR